MRDTEIHRRAILLGAMGLVLKDKATEVLIKAIERVHSGEGRQVREQQAQVVDYPPREQADQLGHADLPASYEAA